MNKPEGELWLLEDSEADAEIFSFAADAVAIRGRVRHFLRAEDLLAHAERLAAAGSSAPRLVFVDLNLPGLGGKELIERLRRVPGMLGVPLLVLSTSASRVDVHAALAAGAAAYLVKPLGIARYEEMLKAVKGFWLDLAVPGGSLALGLIAGAIG